MTIKELINKLSKCDLDSEIEFCTDMLDLKIVSIDNFKDTQEVIIFLQSY